MSDSGDRTHTDGAQLSSGQSVSLSRTYTTPELTAQLRNVGARIRKSVMEGYTTPPTSRAFGRAQTTPNIFASAKDINRDVFGPSSRLRQTSIGPANPHPKRSRSVDRGSDTEPDEDDDHDMAIGDNASNVPGSVSLQNKADRVVKPLRKQRGMMETQSLPVGAFQFSRQSLNPPTAMAAAVEEEEDWSVGPSASTSNESSFKPVVFE